MIPNARHAGVCCGSCRCFLIGEGDIGVSFADGDDDACAYVSELGVCRRYAPRLQHSSKPIAELNASEPWQTALGTWPLVNANDWCGEYIEEKAE